MKNPDKKELIEEITSFFEDYEEAYIPGEWELFSQAKKGKYTFISQWIKIAAVFFLIASVLPFRLSDIHKNEIATIAQLKSVTQKINQPSLKEEPHRPLSSKPTVVVNSTVRVAIHQQNQLPVISQDSEMLTPSKNLAYNIEKNRPVIIPEVVHADTIPLSHKKSTIDFLLSESKVPSVAVSARKKEKDAKWNFGIEVMPTIMKSNLNMGAGLTTAYKLSRKFSLSSGISILQLEGGGAVPSAGNNQSAVSLLSAKQLTSVDANISAIDIPVTLIYNLNKNFYTTVGVSYLNVVNEKRSNTYVKASEFLSTNVDPQTGMVSAFQALKSVAVEEPVPYAPLQGNSYLGFFNLSVGRQQNIFDHYNILIEPFIKIPMGKLSSEDLKLTNSGVKFKFSF